MKNSKHSDLPKIASCHRSAFPKSFSTQLGQKYCEKMLAWYLSTDKAFLFHFEEKDKVIGYCGGIVNDGTLSTGSSSAMMQYSFNQAIKSLAIRPWLFFHPEMFKNYTIVLKNVLVKLGLKKHKRSTVSKEKSKKEPVVGLVVIGVDAQFHGKGYGSKLLQEFEKKAKEIGVNKISLSVKSSNSKAIKSYKRNDWVETKRDEISVKMIKNL